MFHPYVIDTSVIYNLSGVPYVKPGLKRLTSTFLRYLNDITLQFYLLLIMVLKYLFNAICKPLLSRMQFLGVGAISMEWLKHPFNLNFVC